MLIPGVKRIGAILEGLEANAVKDTTSEAKRIQDILHRHPGWRRLGIRPPKEKSTPQRIS